MRSRTACVRLRVVGGAHALARVVLCAVAMRVRYASILATAVVLSTPPANAEPAPAPHAVATRSTTSPWSLPPCAAPEAEGPLRLVTGCSGTVAARAAINGVSGAGPGMTLAAEGEDLFGRGYLDVHTSHRFGIGGGQSGFDGLLQGSLAVGVRLPVGRPHGLVLRGGGFGYVRGNRDYYASLLEFPQVQIGYQYRRGTAVVELGATTGGVHNGRERAGATRTRYLGLGVEVGAYAIVRRPWLRLGARLMRLPTMDALDGPVMLFEGFSCGVLAPVALCSDVRLSTMRAIDDVWHRAEAVTGIYLGLSVGITRDP